MSQIPPSIGPYEILAKLGEGGMGVVYRARDPKLGREVAIKALPDAVANDAERLARFEREARTLASLNHPHIAQVHAIEGTAIVMELVEGEDLAERLTRGPIPLDEAIAIARQIAEALEAAHDAGIIHRDLKPANVKVRPDGTVKVLDFGLAKVIDTVPEGRHFSAAENSPTITTPAMTMQGVILGTAAYMAPEQAKGKFVDRRADIWAFGCVLYEMLTGARTFLGEDVSDTLVSILRDDPRWAALPADTPPHIRQLLRRCLQKDPRKRLPHIGAARIELSEHATDTPLASAPEMKRRPWLAMAGFGAFAGALLAAAAMYVARPAPVTEPREAVQFTVDTTPGTFFPGTNGAARFALSPDGRELVYQMQGPTGTQWFIRALDSSTSQPVPGTTVAAGGNDAQQAFWSPDGRFIAFFDETSQQLKKLDRGNGLVQPVADVPGNQLGGSWSDAGVILFASAATQGVRSVSADGGTVTPVTRIDASRQETAHLWPSWLPDGRHFVYQSTTDASERAIYLASLDGGTPVRLFASETAAVVAPPDQLLFGRDGALMSQGFDMRTFALIGEPRIVADHVPASGFGRLAVSASRNGVLAYSQSVTGADSSPLETYWTDRVGKPVRDAPPAVGVNGGIRLSRDGRSLAYYRGLAFADIWIQDTVTGIETPLRAATRAGQGPNLPPVFSPDGTRVLSRSTAPGASALSIQAASGTTPPVEVARGGTGEQLTPYDWAPDGRLLFGRTGGANQRRLQLLHSEGSRQPIDYLDDFDTPRGVALSPDGKWLAYAMGARGRSQVFIQSFPDPSLAKAAASGVGAMFPRWNPKGGELFYLDDVTRRLMAVPVTTAPRLAVGVAVGLFDMNLETVSNPFDVMPDGARFVAIRARGSRGEQRQSIVVTVNWRGQP